MLMKLIPKLRQVLHDVLVDHGVAVRRHRHQHVAGQRACLRSQQLLAKVRSLFGSRNPVVNFINVIRARFSYEFFNKAKT